MLSSVLQWVAGSGWLAAFVIAVYWGREIRSRSGDKSRWQVAEDAAATLELSNTSLKNALQRERMINDDWAFRVSSMRNALAECDADGSLGVAVTSLNKLLSDKAPKKT